MAADPRDPNLPSEASSPELSGDAASATGTADLLALPFIEQWFAASSEAIALVDLDLHILKGNAALAHLLDVPLPKVTQHRLDQFIDDPKASLLSQLPAASLGQQIQAEVELRRPNGQVRQVDGVAIAHWMPQQHLLLLRDLTDQRAAAADACRMKDAIDREQQARTREQFIATISQAIRQSLEVCQILNTTVDLVRQFLSVDRVVIYRFRADWSGSVVAESLSHARFSIRDRPIEDACFRGALLHPYREGRIHHVNDIVDSNLDPCYVSLLSSINVRAVLVIPIVVHEDLWGLLVAHHCTGPHQWAEVNWLSLQQISTQLGIGIHQAQLYQQVQQQAQRERLLNRLGQAIRSQLNLERLFETASTEIGQQLHLNRVEIVRYLPREQMWINIACYRSSPTLINALGLSIPDEENQFADQLRQLEPVQINSYAAEADTQNQPFVSSYPGAWLLVPLLVSSEVGGVRSPTVWGSLSLNRLEEPYDWQPWEVELAQRIATQLSTAIQQSQLYEATQTLNTALEYQVQMRTEQLQQSLEFEALLKRITDNVRDSLDEAEILQTVVQELGQVLDIAGCDVALHRLQRQESVIVCEYLVDPGLASVVGRTTRMEYVSDRARQYAQKVAFQFCSIVPEPTRTIERRFSVLACPIVDDRQTLGDLWLMRRREESFSPAEIRLVEQAANQCAIALRQSRLYQAAQAQVQQLERLNRLKDDFLSTVSHELRTPIANIKMATQMLEIILYEPGNDQQLNQVLVQSALQQTPLDASRGSPTQRLNRYFQILQDECRREIQLINNLLDLSRLDADTEPLMLTSIDLAAWAGHVVEPFIIRTKANHQTLAIGIPATLLPITTDLSYLERILSELLNNACKYTPAHETITLSVTRITPTRELDEDANRNAVHTNLSISSVQALNEDGVADLSPNPLDSDDLDLDDQADIDSERRIGSETEQKSAFEIRLCNSGIVIPEQEYDLIFEKFYRIPTNDPWKHEGTGLGLALVKKLVANLHGTIKVCSDDHQTCFVLTLPNLPERTN